MRTWWRWLGATVALTAVTAAGLRLGLNASTAGFVFLIVVLLISIEGGLLIGTAASLGATLCFNYFFLPPLHTFRISEPANWVALAAFLASSVIASRLVVAAREQAAAAEQRRNELETLYALSVDLFTATSRSGALGTAATRALQLLGAREGGLVLFEGHPPVERVVAWNGPTPAPIQPILGKGEDLQHPIELQSELGRDVYVPLIVGGAAAGALVARGTAASQAALASATRLIALAVERERFLEETAHMEALRESESLKTSLLRAISHDLATPITAITIETEALRRHAGQDDELRASVDAIGEETGRLRRRIDNLLSMARLEAGKARPHREPTPAADLFRAVRENLPAVLTARPITIQVSADCPDADVDPSLTLEILLNLLENAHRVAPAGTPIALVAARHPGDASTVRLEILDRGPGLPPGVADAAGNLAAETSDVAQRGLGLEIARSLAAANGGRIALLARDGGGTIARVDLPAAHLEVAGPA